MKEHQLDQTLSFIDGYLTAQMVLGRSPESAFAHWTDQLGGDFEDELAAYRQRKVGLPERLYFTDDFVGSAERATEWMRGVARAALLDPDFMPKLSARQDEVPQMFRAVFLGLTLEGGGPDTQMTARQRESLEHVRDQARQFRGELGRVGGRKRLNLLAGVLGVLDAVQRDTGQRGEVPSEQTAGAGQVG